MTKVIIFDADGVVINSPAYFSVQYAKEFGIEHDEIMLPFFLGIFEEAKLGKVDLKEILQPVMKDWKWKGSVDELLDWWFKSEHHIDERIVKEIRRLQEKGIKCCLGTKQEKYRAEYIRKVMGFEKIFDELYISCEMGVKKPDRRFFEIIQNDLAEKYSVKPEEIMIWDNKEENVSAARESGWQGYLYTNFSDFSHLISKI
jgi:putative hydrolase of the HAD superfamily